MNTSTAPSLEIRSLEFDIGGIVSPPILSIDETYRRLRQEGHGGWGGVKFSSRLEGWCRQTSAWLLDPRFPHAGARLLELGCGNGAVAALFAARGYQVVGTDVSRAALAWARDQFASHQLSGDFQLADVTEGLRQFGDQSFQVVVDGNCLHCILGPGRARAFAAVRRVLAPHGVCVVSSMCGEPRSQELRAAFDPHERYLERNGTPYRYLPTYDGLVAEVLAAGFRILSTRLQQNEWGDHLWLLVSHGSYSQ
jgi:SAM-dependent methyltransferase